jgi:hypothetical protein
MCTGSALVAGVPRARRPYAENHVSGGCLARMRGSACPGRACARGALVRRTWAARPGQRHGCGGLVPDAAVGRRALVGSCSRPGARVGAVCGWACRGLGDAVSSRCAGSGTRARWGWCGVRWLFQGCCPGGRLSHLAPFCVGDGWVTETFLTVRTLRVARS